MRKVNLYTSEYLHECFSYVDGRLFWKSRPRHHFKCDENHVMWNTSHSGKEAGSLCPASGRRMDRWRITLNGSMFSRTHIVWAMHGREFTGIVDHENRNPIDDRIENLRISTNQENSINSSLRKDNNSGYKGVSWDKPSGRWKAQLYVSGVNKNLGRFDDPVDAHEAYMKAARERFGEFVTDGRRESL